MVVEPGALLGAGALDLLSLDDDAGLLSFDALPESDFESDLESDFESAFVSDLESESPPDEPPSDELLLGA